MALKVPSGASVSESQHSMVLSVRSPQTWYSPAAIAVKVPSGGSGILAESGRLQHWMVLSAPIPQAYL